jgi:hypothetical protein
MTTDHGAGPNQPADLEEALWAAVDHARIVGDRHVAARLLMIISDLPNRWVPCQPAPRRRATARQRNLVDM